MADSSCKEGLFGTDGIRGTPGFYPLTDGMVFKIGLSVAKIINYKDKLSSSVVIGRDTRLTGKHIETILCDAINFYGIDVFSAGVITTPGLSFLVKDLGADMGIMISASHNKPTDNGIKFFNPEGFKLPRDEEAMIESIIFSNLIHRPAGIKVQHKGEIKSVKKAREKYIDFLISSVGAVDLSGLHIVVDCGWGAASGIAARLYRKLKARVTSIHDKPKGENINIGGALKPDLLAELVCKEKADIGVALDGDGDRCILIDEKGNILDGDYILAIMAEYLIGRKELPKNTVVATVMSNLGLKQYIKDKGGNVVITSVGDKHVLEALKKNGLNLGGEQSGHIIFLDYLPSPDGLLASLQVLKVIKDTGKPLSELTKYMTKFPQVLVNVEVKAKIPFKDIPSVHEKLDYFNDLIKDSGRILLRYSGTENLARIMVEGKDKKLITEIANTLAEVIKREIGTTTEELHK